MAGKRQSSSMGPPKPKKATSRQLRIKAELILKSKKNANVLCEVLEMFNRHEKNYTPVLLTVEMIFCTLLRRGDFYEEEEALEYPAKTPESVHARWLRSNYNLATKRTLECMKRGEESSRIQALVTSCKMMVEEGRNEQFSGQGVIFPYYRLKNMFEVLLDSEQAQTTLINRFQEYAEYRDVQQYGLKALTVLAHNKGVLPKVEYHALYDDGERMMPGILRMYKSARSPSEIYMQNYLELFDVLAKPGLNKTPQTPSESHEDDKYLIKTIGTVSVLFDPELCKRYINRCWGFCVQWPLRSTERNHRRALIVLVDRIMPHLTKPALSTDLLCDSLDCGSSISMIALRGMLELITKHRIDFPDIYDRLYGMFEPEMFATRSKKRLIHLADVFLSSTRLTETMVAAFAKRLARLALIASPEDANDLLQLVANVVQRHPGLKKMLRNDQPAIMPKDPYVMDESCSNASRAIQSSLWEVSALQQHFTPEVSATAMKVMAAADPGARPADLTPAYPDQEQFDMEIKKRFKSIEMNFIRPSLPYCLMAEERLSTYWDVAGD